MCVRGPIGSARDARTHAERRYGPDMLPRFRARRVASVFFLGADGMSVNVLFWPRAPVVLIDEYREQRNPMFVFVLDGALFRFSVNTPSIAPLFQFPPRIKARAVSRRGPAHGPAWARRKPTASSIRRASSRSRLRARRRTHTASRL